MAPDSDSARAAFEASTDFTVGIEEEFALLDAGDLGLTARFDELRAAAADDPVLCDSVAGELIASEIEIRSGRGEDLAAAIAAQRARRRRLFALAQERGIALGATGTHPWSDYREQHIIQTDHYRRVEDGLKYVAWRNNTFSVHVHVGIRGADRAVQVCDRLRPVLPLLLAISANSPFLDGRDSGLHSARTQTFTKSFPRCGVPDTFGSWDAFAKYIDFLVRTQLDRRVHAGVVVGAAAFLVRHRGGANLRRPVHRGGVRGPGGADRGLRRAGGAGHRRRRAQR